MRRVIWVLALMLAVAAFGAPTAAAVPVLMIEGQFDQSTYVVGESGTLTYKITNNDSTPVGDLDWLVDMTPQFDLNVATSTTSCDTTPTLDPTTEVLEITDGTVAGSDICEVTLNFTTTSVGAYTQSNDVVFVNNVALGQGDVEFNNASTTVAAPAPLTAIGGHNQSQYVVGETGTVVYTVHNPNPVPVLDLDWKVRMHYAFEINDATSNATCDATPAITWATGEFEITNGAIAANSSCTVTIHFRAKLVGSDTFPLYSSDGIIYVDNVSQGNSGVQVTTATIVEPAPLTAAGGYNKSNYVVGETGFMAYTITNPNAAPVFDLDWQVRLGYQFDLDIATSGTTCDATPDISGFWEQVEVTDGTIAANDSCTVTLNFIADVAGAHTYPEYSSHGSIYVDNDSQGNGNVEVTTAAIAEPAPVLITGGFDQAAYLLGDSGTLAFTVTNPNPLPIDDLDWNVNLPAQFDLNVLASSTTCDATPNIVGSVELLEITDAPMAANSNCTITMVFRATSLGPYTHLNADVFVENISQGNTNVEVASTRVILPDSIDPTVTISTPFDNEVVGHNAIVNADYTCADPGGSGIATCVGNVADGAPINTSTIGVFTFAVTAIDYAGNQTVLYHDYNVALACNGQLVTIDMNLNGGNGVGTAGDDVILGTPVADDIRGSAGDDTICGGDGADTIRGGGGADFIDGGPGDDTIKGQGGLDIIDGGDGDDSIDGLGAADTIDGGAGADTINGQNGGDIIDGGPGADTIKGQTGPDTLTGGQDDDDLFGGNGNDTLYGGSGSDKCSGNLGGNDQAEDATCEQTPGIEVLF